jgi:hypothetical protein
METIRMQWMRNRLLIPVVAIAIGFATPALGTRAWWVLPPIVFVGLLAMMFWTRRDAITARWVLFVASVAVVLGAVLRVL